VRWRSYLNFPSVPRLSPEVIDFIERLLTDAEERMTFEQLKEHPFFAGFDWSGLERADGPFIPNIRSPEDVSAFEPCDEDSSAQSTASDMSEIRQPQVLKYAFLGYTYRRPQKAAATGRSIGFE
jgi:protein-serine/threonine kinase